MNEPHDQDGFKLVGSKQRSKNYSKKAPQLHKVSDLPKSPTFVDESSVSSLANKINILKSNLINKDNQYYWTKFQFIFNNIIDHFYDFGNLDFETRSIYLICYGLGSLEDNFLSRYQFALLLLMIDELKSKSIKINLIELFDPVFTELDKCLLLNNYKFNLATENTRCIKSINELLTIGSENELNSVLFYMPHCARPLYNNLLFSNWSHQSLSKIILLGNSFRTIEANTSQQLLNTSYTFVRDGLHLCEETAINCECEFTNAFVDLSFHLFDKNRLSNQLILNNLLNKFEVQLKTPVYGDSDEIF